MRHHWEQTDVDAAVAILAAHNRAQFGEAVRKIGERIGAPVDARSLKQAFARRGLRAPTTYTIGGGGGPTGFKIETVYGAGPTCAAATSPDVAEAIDVDVSDFDAGEVVTPDRTFVDRKPEPVERPQPPANNVERVAFIPDCHIPSHDEKALTLALRAIETFKPDTLVILGDFGDYASVSFHGHNPAKLERLSSEVDAVNAWLDVIDAMALRCGTTRKAFAHGNHGARVSRYIAQNAPELHGLVSLDEMLRLVARGWEVIQYRAFGTVGKLLFTHDVGHAGALSAARSRDTAGKSCVVGHSHAAGVSYRGTALGSAHVGMSAGWLGDRTSPSFNYMHNVDVMRNWQHGFGIAYVERDTGNCHVHFVPVVEGRCVIEGRIIQ